LCDCDRAPATVTPEKRGVTIIGRRKTLGRSGAKTLHHAIEGDSKEQEKTNSVAQIADSQRKAVSDLRDGLTLGLVLFGPLLSAAWLSFLGYIVFEFIRSVF
jgi:hypothetical protein